MDLNHGLGSSRDVLDIRYYPVSGQESSIRLDPVFCIWYKTISGIIWYPVSGRISYPVLSGTVPTAAKHCSHWFIWYVIVDAPLVNLGVGGIWNADNVM